MILLTDIPDRGAALLSGLAGTAAINRLEPQAVPDLTEAETRLWFHLGSARAPHRLRLEVAGPAAFWTYLLVVEDAPASQFDLLRDLAAEPSGLPGPVACLALRGKGFHGHRGRGWQVEPGNLHLSTACDPHVTAASCGLAMTALPAVAVRDALGDRLPPGCPVGIKWVNDLQMGGRKVGGVLTATQSLRGRLDRVIFGIGINVERRPDVAPTLFVPGVTSLRDESPETPCDLATVLAAVLAALARRLHSLREQGPGPLLDAYRDASVILGRRVRIWDEGLPDVDDPARLPPPLAEGEVLDIGDDLSLRLAGLDLPVTRGRLALDRVTGSGSGP